MSTDKTKYALHDELEFGLWAGKTIAYITADGDVVYATFEDLTADDEWELTQSEAEGIVAEFDDFQKFP